MKVKELVQELLKMDQELDVWLTCSDGDDLTYDEECCSVEEALMTPHGVFGVSYCDEDDKEKYGKVVLVS